MDKTNLQKRMDIDCIVVDDEEVLGRNIQEYFEMSGLHTLWVNNSKELIDIIENNNVRIILLDVNLGDESGFSICKDIRKKYNTPIFFISARNSDDDILLALGVGGDDYIKKPFSLGVLLAKVNASLRRQSIWTSDDNVKSSEDVKSQKKDEFIFDDYSLRYDLGRLFMKGEEIPLTQLEYALLEYLTRNSGRIISKDEIFEKVWQDSITGDGTLNVHIRRLREKIELDPANPKFIKTVWGTGYLFENEGKI
ncbi:MAG: response regulator transcription factor [Lachnospiraceae bacterium]|jgi:two-component system response regulator RegX3|nr:response regulator transcription factor [Lachnospiraceae bacterium]